MHLVVKLGKRRQHKVVCWEGGNGQVKKLKDMELQASGIH